MTNELNYNVSKDTDNNDVIIFTDLPQGLNLSTNISGIYLINNGEIARSKKLNDNFIYLNARIENANNNVITMKSSVQSTIQSTLSIYQDINVLGTSGTIELKANTVNSITPTGDVTFVLPTVEDKTQFYQILVQLTLNDIYTLNLGTISFFNSNAPSWDTTGHYNIIYEYDNSANKWFCGVISKQ